MEETRRRDTVFVFLIFVICFFLILVKAFYVQVVTRDRLIDYSKSQTIRSVTQYPNRGNIYDRNGHPLAVNIQTYSVFSIPKKNKDYYKRAKSVCRILKKNNCDEILASLKKRNSYTWIARRVELSKDDVEKIKKTPDFFIDAVPKRYYPNDSLLSQYLGFVGIDNKGLSGVEYFFDQKLRGKPHITKYIKDAKGRPVKYTAVEAGEDPADIYLSIDKDIQGYAETLVKEAIEHHSADGAGIAIMDSETGEMVALASAPNFNPNDLSSSNPHFRRPVLITDPFEPGSIFKIITIASALDNKIAKAETNYYCEKGQLKVDDHIITEAESKSKFEWLSLKEIIKYSSNIGTTKVAFDLTYPRFFETINLFGFGEKTGIEMAGESRGIVPAVKGISALRLSNVSFGQGIATTPIQMLSAYSTIANGGYKVHPTLIKKEIDEQAKESNEKKHLISPEMAKTLENMLLSVVEGGSGVKAKIPYYAIAGKTSTAQRVSPRGGYEGYVSGFIGFPINVDKRFVIYSFVNYPKGREYYGGQVAAPIFKKMAQYILYRNKDLKQEEMGDQQKNTIAGDTRLPASREKVERVPMRSDIIPDFRGLDKKSVIYLAGNYRHQLDLLGQGIVKHQSPSAGEMIGPNQKIKVTFEVPNYE
jgi:cell division protein FtsI (penicillin-binding protein 3)